MQIVIFCLFNFLLGLSVFPVKSEQAKANIKNRHYYTDECMSCIAIGNENTPTHIQTGLYGLTAAFGLTTREFEISQRLDTETAANPLVKFLGFAIGQQEDFSQPSVFGVMPYYMSKYSAEHIPGIRKENGKIVGKYLINIVPLPGTFQVYVRDRVVCTTEVRSLHNCYMDSPNMRYPPTMSYMGTGVFSIEMDKVNVRYSKQNRQFTIEFEDPHMRLRNRDKYHTPQLENTCGFSPHFHVKFLGATPYERIRPIIYAYRFDADTSEDRQPKQVITLPEDAITQLINAPTIAKEVWRHVTGEALKNQISLTYCFCKGNEKACSDPGLRSIDDIKL